MKAEIVMVQEFPIEGVLRLRVDTFREPGESGYEEHHVKVPIIPPEGYPGELDEGGNPRDSDAYNAWVESLPEEERVNPCLCQFIKVPLGTHQLKIKEIVQAHTQRVKAAPIEPKTGFPDVLDKSISRGLDNHLTLLRINRMRVKARSIRGMDAVIPDHKLLGVGVTE